MSTLNKKFDSYLTNHLSNVNNQDSSLSRKHWLKYNYHKYLPETQDARILEIGPGFGDLLTLLHIDLGYKNTQAVDVSKEVVAYCNSLVENSTEILTDTSQYLQEFKDKFDVVFMLHVLEHIDKSETVDLLSKIRESLSLNGVLIVEVPNMANPLIGLNIRYADFTHEVGFTNVSLMQVLQKAGFTKISIHPSEVPTVSLFRLAQHYLQKMVNFMLTVLINIYLPKQSQILSPSIFAVAIKSDIS